MSLSIYVVFQLFFAFFGSLSWAVRHVAPERLVLKLKTRHRELRRDVAAKSARNDRNQSRYNNSDKVERCLLLERAITWEREHCLTLELVGEAGLSVSQGQTGDDTAKNAGNTVQELHTARVVQLQVGLAPLLAFEETEGRDNTSDTAEKHRKAGTGPNDVAASAHNDTAREDGVQQDFHIEGASHYTTCEQGTQGTRSDAEHGVNNSDVSSHSTSQDTVEAGPIDEKETGSDHRDHLVRIATSVQALDICDGPLALEEVSRCQAEVRAEHVNGHGAADIVALKDVEDEDHVHRVPDRLASHQEEQLRKGCLAEQCAHRDKTGSSAEVSLE